MNDLAANSAAEQFTRPRANSLYEVMQMAEDQLQQPQSSCSSSSSSSASKPCAKGRPVSRLSLDRSKQAVAKKLSGKGHAQQPEERQPHHDAPRAAARDERSAPIRRGVVHSESSCCAHQTAAIARHCKPAVRTTSERHRMRSSKLKLSRYNFARLSPIILNSAYDLHGNLLVHRQCLARELEVSMEYITNLRAKKRESLGSPLVNMSKADATKRHLLDSIVLPIETDHLTQLQYLSSLSDTDLVQIPSARVSNHGLAGKQSNHALR